jgi:PAS domain S-box-containing protein
VLKRLSLPTTLGPHDAVRGSFAVALRCAIAVAVVVVAEILFRILSRHIEPLPPFIIFYPSILLIAVLCGLGPALLALTLCAFIGIINGVSPLVLGIFLILSLALLAVLRRHDRVQQGDGLAYSDVQRLLEKTEAEREWYALVLRSITEEVYFTDLEGRYRYANHAVLNEFGHERVEGVPVTDIVARLEVYRADGSPRPIEEAPPLRALKGEIIRDEEQIVRIPRTGEFRHRQVSSAPVRNADGEIIGSVSVVRDITQQKRIEEALREADRRKDVFISTLSHELRNPLAPIRTAAMVMESPRAGSQEVERARQIIVRQVTHMASLLDDLLEVSRYTRGDLSLRKSQVPLQQVLEGAIEVAQPLLQEKHHQLHIDVPHPSPVVDVDPMRLTQVVSNLLTNAAKYTNVGGRYLPELPRR